MSAIKKLWLIMISAIATSITGSLLLALLVDIHSSEWKIRSAFENVIGFGFFSIIGILPATLFIAYPLLLLGVKVPKSYVDSIAICAISGGLVGAIILILMGTFQSPWDYPDFTVLSLYSGFGFYFGVLFGFFVTFFNNRKNITN